jgi:hypothetical protein
MRAKCTDEWGTIRTWRGGVLTEIALEKSSTLDIEKNEFD